MQPIQDGSHGPPSVNTRTHHIYPTGPWWGSAPFGWEYDWQGGCRDIGLECKACLSWLAPKGYENRPAVQIQDREPSVHYPNFVFFPPDAVNPVITNIGYGYTANFGVDMIEGYPTKCAAVTSRKNTSPIPWKSLNEYVTWGLRIIPSCLATIRI